MLVKKINAPLTSSVGRLFDVMAALIGLRERVSFEGQAAMELEYAIEPTAESYPFIARDGMPHVIDWEPAILEVMRDIRHETVGVISAKFHNMLAEIVVAITRKFDEPRVVLTGGCFQNKYLAERAVKRLREENCRPYWHQHVPPNDGGIALGQIVAAGWAARAPAQS